MKQLQHCRLLFVTLLALGTSLAACSSGNGDGGTSPPPPGEVSLDPTTAPAGSMVKVDGLELDACPLHISEIRVGGHTAPTVLNARHEALMRLPLFYDEDRKWAAPPAGPQDVEIFCNGDLWLTLPAAIRVTELPPAPGTTEAMVADYRRVIADYKALTEALAPEPGILRQFFAATFAALEELVAGDDPNSLLAQLETLEQTEPDVLALMDAVYAAVDVDEAVAAYRDYIEDLNLEAAEFALESIRAPSAEQSQPPSALPQTSLKRGVVFELPFPIEISDANLALLMRSHHGIAAFSKDFIEPTAESFGTFEGIFSIFIKSKLASTINAVLSLLDFTLNKVVVSAMPSALDEIDLQQVPPFLANSEVTSSRFIIRASNVPAVLTITDVASAILMTMGLDDPPGTAAAQDVIDWTKFLKDKLREVGKLFLETLSKFLKQIAKAPGGFEYDFDAFAVVPQMRFEATGETRELYRLYPERSQVIAPLSEQLQWQASDVYWGSAAVWVTPAAAAFGPYTAESEHVRVQVGELALVLEDYTVDVPEGYDAEVGVKLSNAPPQEEGVLEVFAIRVDGDADIRVTSRVPMLFDDTNWDEFQYVALAAAQDDDTDDDYATVLVSTVVDTVVEEPVNIEAALTAQEVDDDRMWFVVDPSAVRIPEGETAEVDVKLSQVPSSQVNAIVTHAYGDTDIAVQSPAVMRFDEDNWDVYQTVTLYAYPDEDLIEGSARLRVSANPPAKVDDTYITATEDEEGDLLIYEWTIDYGSDFGRPRYVATGAIPVALDNEADPETVLGTAVGTATVTVGDPPEVNTGTVALTVRNYWTDTICYCGTTACYTNPDPESDAIHMLAVDTQISVNLPSAKQEGRTDIVVIVEKGTPYSVSYSCSAYTTGTVHAELR